MFVHEIWLKKMSEEKEIIKIFADLKGTTFFNSRL